MFKTTITRHRGSVLRPTIGVLVACSMGLLVAAVSAQAPMQNYDSPALQHLSHALQSADSAALERFWTATRGHEPLVEPIEGDGNFRWLTFIYKGDSTTRDVIVGQGDIPTPDPSKWHFHRLGDSDLWFKTDRIPRDARFGYLLQVDGGPPELDPLNDRQYGGRSVVETPDAPAQPWIKETEGTPKGRLSHVSIHSRVLNQERSLGVYTPATYDNSKQAAPLLIVFDGEAYGTSANPLVPTPTVLDNLIHGNDIPPTIAVLVDNMSQKDRDRDMKCSAPFEDFLTNELLPWIRVHYRVTSHSREVVLAGSSDGGLFAFCAALRFPQIFGNVLSQSADVFYDPQPKAASSPYTHDSAWLTEQFLSRPRLPVRFYLEVGTLAAGVLNPVLEHRRLRDVLRAKGYSVFYSEFSGGHDYLTWRNSVGDGLVQLLGRPQKR